ncbi:MAG: SDR family oxidoreductase [Gammaproteobacteria bacterium]|jgi:NAD(P)-dependent dehydrogenase (short-subunit alcohol dehydrogenase family)|nr:SDR family oxidoreductase [Gammaproteobacteria bacterium]
METYLEGRIAIVTGGFSGIGKAIALALAARGATIAVGARSLPETAIEELDQVAERLFCQRLDVADNDSIDAFIDGLASAYGHADILVNSAGVTTHEFVCGHDEQSWLDVIDINLSGPFRMIRACLPPMIECRWGRIINIGSTAATTAVADHAAYCASKSGLLGLNRAVALEGAPHGVSSVVISPTWVQTEMFDQSMAIQAHNAGRSVDEEIAMLVAQQPQKRLVQAHELGSLAAFLCHDDALGITMEDIQVNAGALW